MFTKSSKTIIPLLCCICIFSCNNNQSSEIIAKTDTAEQKNQDTQNFPLKDTAYLSFYPIIITPDTNNCSSFKRYRSLITNIQNDKASVEAINSILYLKTDKYKLWTCNLPKEVKKIGDTVLVSAYIYSILGSEKTWGYPSIITKIRLKKAIAVH